MEPAQLSRVFRGRQNLSPGKARFIAGQLLDTETERDYFVSLVEMATAKRTTVRDEARARALRLREACGANLPADALGALTSWVHVAVLDLLELRAFSQKQVPVMAKLLGVSPLEVRLALEALLSSALIRTKGGKLEKCTPRLRASSGIPNATIRALHKQYIQKAHDSVDGQSIDERYLLAKTLAVSKGDIPKLRALIDDFSRRVSDLAAAPGKKDDLYQLNAQCFRLLKGKIE